MIFATNNFGCKKLKIKSYYYNLKFFISDRAHVYCFKTKTYITEITAHSKVFFWPKKMI